MIITQISMASETVVLCYKKTVDLCYKIHRINIFYVKSISRISYGFLANSGINLVALF